MERDGKRKAATKPSRKKSGQQIEDILSKIVLPFIEATRQKDSVALLEVVFKNSFDRLGKILSTENPSLEESLISWLGTESPEQVLAHEMSEVLSYRPYVIDDDLLLKFKKYESIQASNLAQKISNSHIRSTFPKSYDINDLINPKKETIDFTEEESNQYYEWRSSLHDGNAFYACFGLAENIKRALMSDNKAVPHEIDQLSDPVEIEKEVHSCFDSGIDLLRFTDAILSKLCFDDVKNVMALSIEAPVAKECLYCNSIFLSALKNPHAKFCSDKCRVAQNNSNARKNPSVYNNRMRNYRRLGRELGKPSYF